MTVKYLLRSCAEVNDIKLRCFGDSISNIWRECLGENETNSSTIKFLKESGIYSRVCVDKTVAFQCNQKQYVKQIIGTEESRKGDLSMTLIISECKG